MGNILQNIKWKISIHEKYKRVLFEVMCKQAKLFALTSYGLLLYLYMFGMAYKSYNRMAYYTTPYVGASKYNLCSYISIK